MRAVLGAIANFLRERGYWPRMVELAQFMRTSKYACQWYIDENLREGVVVWWGKGSYREARLTPKGWAELAIEPITPTRKRVNKTARDKMVEKVVGEVLAELQKDRAR